MKVCLVQPKGFHERWRTQDTLQEQLGLAYLAAHLRHAGHEVEIIDGVISWLRTDQLLDRIAASKADLVGVTTTCLAYLGGCLRLTELVRELLPKAKILLGGHGLTVAASTWPDLTRRILSEKLWIDGLLLGEGEEVILDLLAHLMSGERLATVPRFAPDLNRLHWPSRDLLPQVLDNGVSTANVLSSRGCLGTCRFCSVHALHAHLGQNRWRAREAEDVVREIADLHRRFGVKQIFFADDNFLGKCPEGYQRGLRIAEMLAEQVPGIGLAMACRADDISPDLFLALRRAGLQRVFLGIESGSDACLRRWQKQTTVEINRRAVRILKDLDIQCVAGFIMVDRDSTLQEIEENIAFLRDTGLIDAIEPPWAVLEPFTDPSRRTVEEVLSGRAVVGRLPELADPDAAAVLRVVWEHLYPLVLHGDSRRLRGEYSALQESFPVNGSGAQPFWYASGERLLDVELRWRHLFFDQVESLIALRKKHRENSCENSWQEAVQRFLIAVGGDVHVQLSQEHRLLRSA